MHRFRRFCRLLLAGLFLVSPLALAAPQLARVNGVNIAWSETGPGESLVLIHGFGDCASVWSTLLPALSAHRVITIEMRVHGHSGEFEGPFQFEDSAGDLLGLLDQLGFDRVRAMGISGGGMAPLHAATRQPGRIAAMVVVGAGPPFSGTGARDHARRSRQRAAAGADLLRRLRQPWTGAGRPAHAALPCAEGQPRGYPAVARGAGDDPGTVPVEMHMAIPDASLWIEPDGGHVPIFDDNAPAFADTVLRFLAETGNRTQVSTSTVPGVAK